MFERFTPESREVILNAQNEVRDLMHPAIGASHLLLALCAVDSPAAAALDACGVGAEGIRGVLSRADVSAQPPSGRADFAPSGREALRLAMQASITASSSTIEPTHILIGVLRTQDSSVVMLLQHFGTSIEEIVSALRSQPQASPRQDASAGDAPAEGGRRSRRDRGTKVIDRFTEDLTAKARDGLLDPVVGRDRELERVVTVLCRRTKNNPVLIGEPGVGKSAVAEALAMLMISPNCPDPLVGRRLLVMDLAGLVAGAQYRGDFEERLKGLVKEVTEERAVLFIDEIHTLVGAGSSAASTMGASDMLKPLLARGELTVVGATTLTEYRIVEKDAALERRFAPVTIDPPSPTVCKEIMERLAPFYEQHHGVSFTPAALSAAVDLSERYITDRFLPDKAIDLIDEAGARAAMNMSRLTETERDAYRVRQELRDSLAEHAQKDPALARRISGELALADAAVAANGPDHALVDHDDIAAVIANWTGGDVSRVAQAESVRLLALEDELHLRIVGQDRAVETLARAVRRRRAGLGSDRPASFIFAGPTGVGKTELAKALAETLYGSDDALITLDMSEYMEKHTVSRLIGAPPGYVGHDEPGQLTEPVRRHPFSVVLLDEFEKAHPDVANILLQLLEEGRVTDASGRVVDFTNTIIIATSNLGARDAARPVAGFSNGSQVVANAEHAVQEALRRHLRPELLNRFDDVVVFHPLGHDELIQIVDRMLDRVRTQLAERDLALVLTDDAVALLVQRGSDTAYGARPLRRAVQQLVENPLADLLLGGAVIPSSTVVVTVAADGQDLVFRSEPKASVPNDAPTAAAAR